MGLNLGLGRSPKGEHGNPSSILTWRIPWIEEPGRPQPMGSQSQTRLKQLRKDGARQWTGYCKNPAERPKDSLGNT